MPNKPNASNVMYSIFSEQVFKLFFILPCFLINSSVTAQLKSIKSDWNKDSANIRNVVDNHIKTRLTDAPTITVSAGFELTKLKSFIADVELFFKANNVSDGAIGVYLFREKNDSYKVFGRYGDTRPAGAKYDPAGSSGYSQVSFLLAPVLVTNGRIVKHFISENIDKIPALIPAMNEGTGLCPPACSPR